MSNFWSGWIIILTLGNIAACYWLVRWTAKKRAGEAAEGEVTGHAWDGLEEFNNPLPRWWLWLFYGTIIFSLLYLVLYPGLGRFEGMLGWTKEGQHASEVSKANDTYGPLYKQFASTPIEELVKDEYAVGMGHRLFLNYCAVCHGSDAGGAVGFPDLTDNDWLWGGDAAAIKASIMNGRTGAMPAWGEALGEEGVDNVAAYVVSLSGREADPAKVEAGKASYNAMCAACHTPEGTGNTMLGAADLTDKTWLYGGSLGAIKKTIREGRNGIMPAHKEFLGEDKVHLVSTYVYSLSQKQQ